MMLLTGWLRRMGVGAWSRLLRRRGEGGATLQALDPAGVTVQVEVFPREDPDPVRWAQVAFVARVEPVQVFVV